MSDLRTLLRRYERALDTADRASRALASELRTRIARTERGGLTRCAEELGWSRQRLHDWLKRAGRDAEPALTGSEGAQPVTEEHSTATEGERVNG